MSPLIPLVVACAALTFGAQIPYVPPYVEFKDGTNQAIQEVSRHVVFDTNGNLTEPNRHYLVLVNTLMSLVESLVVNGTDYDDIYLSTVNVAVPQALSNPLKVENEFLQLLAKVEIITRPLKTLIETTCSFDKNNKACNQVISDEVRGDPERYQIASDVLQAAGRLANDFNDGKASEFSDVAARYGELPYLIESQDQLRDFVHKATVVVALI